MKIGFFELEGWEENHIKEGLSKNDLFFSNKKLEEFSIPERKDFEIISVFVNSRITEKILGFFPNLKLITTRSTGFDHIDLESCKKRGIKVAFVPGYGDNTVAEFAFGLILNLTRKIYQSIDQIKEAGSFSLNGLQGIDLRGKTLGIIGTGRIGKEAVLIAKGFGMAVLAFDLFPDKKFAKQNKIKYVELDELLGNSDIITIHCPYNEKTHHLINKGNISLIKKGAFLINTARGGIVETDALVDALDKGILAGAGLDVLEEEGETKDEVLFLEKGHLHEEELKTIIENHILMKYPNVLITPHNAFNTKEAFERILKITLETIQSFLKGKPINLTS